MSTGREAAAFALIAALALLACDRGAEPTAAGAPAGSVIQIGNVVASCEDVAACVAECDAGSADRCRRLGASYEFGKGVAKDPVAATHLYERACAMGLSDSCVSAGRMYEFHHGVDKDDAKAAGFYKRACDAADVTGCANFGILLEAGRGVAQDKDAALRLFEAACTKGAGLACDHARALRGAGGASRED